MDLFMTKVYLISNHFFLSMTMFIEKSIAVHNIKQIHYENKFHHNRIY
jgi:hypothetical protein